jgi:hypothetical protein
VEWIKPLSKSQAMPQKYFLRIIKRVGGDLTQKPEAPCSSLTLQLEFSPNDWTLGYWFLLQEDRFFSNESNLKSVIAIHN